MIGSNQYMRESGRPRVETRDWKELNLAKKPAERACQDARFLRPGDKVVVKKTGDILSVTGLEGRWDDISIRCDDGNTYHHTEVQ